METHVQAIMTCPFTGTVTLLCFNSGMSFISPLVVFTLIFCIFKTHKKVIFLLTWHLDLFNSCWPKVVIPLVRSAYLNTNNRIHWSTASAPYPIFSQPWPRPPPLHCLCSTHFTLWCRYQSPPPGCFIFPPVVVLKVTPERVGAHINHTYTHTPTHVCAHISETSNTY